MIDDGTGRPRLGLAGGFADGPPGGGPRDRADLWRRLLITLVALFGYRIGSYLPMPGLDLAAVASLRQIDFFARGESVPDVSICSLGIMPYISGVIIVLLASGIFPRLGGAAGGGAMDRVRVRNYARILAVVLAAFEAFGVAGNLESIPGVVIMSDHLFTLTTIVALVIGVVFLMWLAEQITVLGIGDGALLILAASALSRLPFNLNSAFEAVRMGGVEIFSVFGALLMVAAFLALVVFVEHAERRIPVYDPGYEIGQGGPPGSYRNVLLRINPAGVLPVLAAGIFVAPLLQSIVAISGIEGAAARDFIGRGFDLVYGGLIVVFAAYFNSAILNAESRAVLTDDEGGERNARRMRSLHIAVATCYVAAVCMLPLLIYRWTFWPFLLTGSRIFLLGWVMTRILEWMRASWRS
jgi:preprotein translocase subunit SecY